MQARDVGRSGFVGNAEAAAPYPGGADRPRSCGASCWHGFSAR